MSLTITISAVAMMLLYAVPGYGLLKCGKIREDQIPSFAMVLMYICSPCLSIDSFSRVEYTPALGKQLLLFFFLSMAMQVAVLLGAYFLLRKKGERDVQYRVYSIATVLGNCAFMGVPLLEALLPEYPAAIACSAVYAVGMNLLGWTVVSYIISRDKTYISVKKMLINPVVLTLPLALFLFISGAKLPGFIATAVAGIGRMSTPLCMLIMGMRLATSKWANLFNNWRLYATIGVKQVLFPLLALGVMTLLPLPGEMKMTMYVICCCPIASVVLNYAEMIGQGQRTAADLVLTATMLSIVTIPLMMLLV